jgi:hypothetical protein
VLLHAESKKTTRKEKQKSGMGEAHPKKRKKAERSLQAAPCCSVIPVFLFDLR